ncbi:hypothetical protein Vi05172_g916 [Venturia inaequalis]|nr:hypothetical protein Vi05172_g916 [Venturia inaequalis]
MTNWQQQMLIDLDKREEEAQAKIARFERMRSMLSSRPEIDVSDLVARRVEAEKELQVMRDIRQYTLNNMGDSGSPKSDSTMTEPAYPNSAMVNPTMNDPIMTGSTTAVSATTAAIRTIPIVADSSSTAPSKRKRRRRTANSPKQTKYLENCSVVVHIQKRDRSGWYEMRCPKCGANASLKSNSTPGGCGYFLGVAGVAKHVKHCTGKSRNHKWAMAKCCHRRLSSEDVQKIERLGRYPIERRYGNHPERRYGANQEEHLADMADASSSEFSDESAEEQLHDDAPERFTRSSAKAKQHGDEDISVDIHYDPSIPIICFHPDLGEVQIHCPYCRGNSRLCQDTETLLFLRGPAQLFLHLRQVHSDQYETEMREEVGSARWEDNGMAKATSYRAFKQFFFPKCVTDPGELSIKMVRVKEIPEDSITMTSFPMLDEDHFPDVIICLDLTLRRLGCPACTRTTALKLGIRGTGCIRGFAGFKSHATQVHGINAESLESWRNKLTSLHGHEELDVEDLEEGRIELDRVPVNSPDAREPSHELGFAVGISAGRITNSIGGRMFPGLPIAGPSQMKSTAGLHSNSFDAQLVDRTNSALKRMFPGGQRRISDRAQSLFQVHGEERMASETREHKRDGEDSSINAHRQEGRANKEFRMRSPAEDQEYLEKIFASSPHVLQSSLQPLSTTPSGSPQRRTTVSLFTDQRGDSVGRDELGSSTVSANSSRRLPTSTPSVPSPPITRDILMKACECRLRHHPCGMNGACKKIKICLDLDCPQDGRCQFNHGIKPTCTQCAAKPYDAAEWASRAGQPCPYGRDELGHDLMAWRSLLSRLHNCNEH